MPRDSHNGTMTINWEVTPDSLWSVDISYVAHPAEPQTHDEPGYPAEAEFHATRVYEELGSGKQADIENGAQVWNQLVELDRRYRSDIMDMCLENASEDEYESRAAAAEAHAEDLADRRIDERNQPAGRFEL
jgi:hypothetical protein